MLYYINPSVVNAAIDNNDTQARCVLFDLLLAWKRNSCIIDSDRNSLQKLANDSSFNEYTTVLKRKQGISSIYKYLDFFAQIAMSDTEDSRKILNATGRIIVVGQSLDVFFFGKNYLLCENSNDGLLYRWGAIYFSHPELSKVRINLDVLNGGGNSISSEMSRCHIEGKMTLAISDSDKKNPSANIGHTANELNRIFNSLHSNFLWLYQLNVHEAENLIPMGILMNIRFKPREQFILKMRKNCKHQMYGELFTYLDFKHGLSSPVLRAFKKDYSPGKFNQMKDLLIKLGINEDKINHALNRTYNKHVKEDFIFQGWGDGLLANTVEYILNNAVPNDISLVDYQRKDWQKICSKVYSIGCSIKTVIN